MDFSVQKTNGKEDLAMFYRITEAMHCCADFSLKQRLSNYNLTSPNRNHSILKIFVVKLK